MLLQWSAETGGCCWRFYQWDRPTLSLGYFQDHRDRHQHTASEDCPIVRRLTGGGAILHDAELTYSLTLPGGHPLAMQRDALYEAVHTSLIGLLADEEITAVLCGGSPTIRSDAAQSGEPFLCFQRRSPGDVLVGTTKIAGSAQRRRRGAVLQHGSVLLRRSDSAPELASLADASGHDLSATALADAWLPKLAERLGLAFDRRPLDSAERARAANLVRACYGCPDWNGFRRQKRRRVSQPTGG